MTSAASDNEPKVRQKRVLPSRSRRGGPGIGSSEVDVMILDMQRRKGENEPAIPQDTPFLLTTNSALVPRTLDVSAGQSSREQRYFDRPEVVKAYQEQKQIQTPQFELLTEDASVGGRFRPRGIEEESADTSDAAYEKRHRKYETFEKRQRFREKEKLKHEQYKLKERIEQLRAMDGSAYLNLPASSFSANTNHTPEDDGTAASSSELPSAHSNGVSHSEGEWRRQEMLDVALALEERYRVLLPSDKKWSDREKSSTTSSSFGDPEATHNNRHEVKIQPEEVPIVEPVKVETQKLKLRIKFTPTSTPTSTVESPAKKSKPSPLSSTPINRHVRHSNPLLSSPGPSSYLADPYIDRDADAESLPEIATLEEQPSSPYNRHADGEESISQARSSKRQRQSDSAKPPSKVHRPQEYQPGALVAAAKRAASAPTARKTQRHITAFGMKIPDEIDAIYEFRLPMWLFPELYEEEEEVSQATVITVGRGQHKPGVLLEQFDAPAHQSPFVSEEDDVNTTDPISLILPQD